MDDATALLHAVLDNPGEDAPRASLADCLMENGPTEFHRYYGRFIACQLAGDHFQEKLWLDTLVGPAALHMPDYAFQMWAHWGDALTPAVHHRGRNVANASDNPRLHFNRWFVRTVKMTMSEFLRLSLALFRRHPIEEVVVHNFGFGRMRSGKWRIYVNNLESVQVARDGVFYLPAAFKTLLKGGSVYHDHYGDREYDAEADALADLSQASVAFARNLERKSRGNTVFDFPTLTDRTELRTVTAHGG